MSKEPLRPDIAAAKGRMNSSLGAGREIKRLERHLWDDEQVLEMTTGAYGKGIGLVVMTDRRLMFIHDARLSQTIEDFPYSKISSVQWQGGLTLGSIVVFASGNKAEIRNVVKAQGKLMVDMLRERLADSPTPDAPAPLQPPPPATGSAVPPTLPPPNPAAAAPAPPSASLAPPPSPPAATPAPPAAPPAPPPYQGPAPSASQSSDGNQPASGSWPGTSSPAPRPEPSPPPPPVAPPAAMWAADPLGRFTQRYWDGRQWTAWVIGADGAQTTDPAFPDAIQPHPAAEGGSETTPDPELQCPHCGAIGQVQSKVASVKEGVSTAKVTGAVLTAGLSALATGVSKKRKSVLRTCGNCNATWVVD